MYRILEEHDAVNDGPVPLDLGDVAASVVVYHHTLVAVPEQYTVL